MGSRQSWWEILEGGQGERLAVRTRRMDLCKASFEMGLCRRDGVSLGVGKNVRDEGGRGLEHLKACDGVSQSGFSQRESGT